MTFNWYGHFVVLTYTGLAVDGNENRQNNKWSSPYYHPHHRGKAQGWIQGGLDTFCHQPNEKKLGHHLSTFLARLFCQSFWPLPSDLFCFFDCTGSPLLKQLMSIFALCITNQHYATSSVSTETGANECEEKGVKPLMCQLFKLEPNYWIHG